jgi:hypothetical protein
MGQFDPTPDLPPSSTGGNPGSAYGQAGLAPQSGSSSTSIGSAGSGAAGTGLSGNTLSRESGSAAGTERVGRVAQGAHETIDRLAQKAAPTVQRLQDSAERARMTGDQWVEDLRSTVREKPLAALATALMAGLVIARLIR